MKLKCMINNQLHKIVQGTPFAEEFNETLDSGSIIISHTEFLQLKPYDHVFIWDADYTFEGFYDDKIILSGKEFTFNKDTRKFQREGVSVFYKHLLINNFTETMLNLKDLNANEEKGVKDYKPIYEYKIQLFSEAKGLETVCAPNISVTQSLNINKKVSTWDYLQRYTKLYSPTYKKVDDESKKTWKFEQKYKISETLKPIFEDSFAPDFSLNNPTLREILSKLMITKDLIPYVVNNVIYGMDITKRSIVPFNKDTSSINYITGNMSSNDFCDNLKKTYSDALSQDNSARLIEYLGFRNSDSALLTLDNMRLETRFPIYKINKIYMCYYKKMIITKEDGKLDYRNFLCKQDITPLVKLNTERNLLKQDWSELENITEKDLKSIDQLKNYKMMTVGYDIGSKNISGWGTKYTYPKIGTFWQKTKTYIENIARNLNVINPYGIYTYEYLKKKFGLGEDNILFMQNPDVLEGMVSPFGSQLGDADWEINNAQKLKSFIFEVDYQAFYNGTVIHTKDNGLDDITVNDNPSSSLTLLEQDGLFTKEKANRFGNKGLTISARYKDKIDENGNVISAFSQMQELGQVYEDHNNKDVVIYHREYQIWENEIICIYYGMHDYVLKNYYTSVYARHRTWSLMPYSESVRRAENRKMMILLDKNNLYHENFDGKENSKLSLDGFDNDNNYLKSIFSAFEPSDVYQSINYIKDNQRLNYGYLKFNDEYYATDLNVFVSGYSLCMNISMPDNISAGAYLDTLNPDDFSDEYNAKTKTEMPNTIDKLNKYLLMKDVEDDYTGSKQKWWSLTDDVETGATKTLGFYCCHTDLSEYYDSSPSDEKIKKEIYTFLKNYPKLDITSIDNKNIIGNAIDIYKDNKELIDMTYQIEPISNNNDILFNQWLMKLSNLTGSYVKLSEDKPITEENTQYANIPFLYCYMNSKLSDTIPNGQGPIFFWKVLKEEFDEIEIGKEIAVSGVCSFEYEPYGLDIRGEDRIVKFSFSPIILTKTSNSSIKLKGTANALWYKAYEETGNSAVDVIEYNFNTFTHFFFFDEEMGTNAEKNARMPDLDTHYWFMSSFSPTVTLQGKKLYYNASVGPSSNDYLTNASTSSEVISRSKTANLKNVIDEIYDSQKYYKNMYICTSSKSKMKKTLVYDEYPFANTYDNEKALYNVGDTVVYNSKVYQCVKKNDAPENFDDSKWLEISSYIKDNHLYAKNKDADYWSNIDLSIKENIDIKDVFEVTEEDFKNCIHIDISNLGKDIQSVHFWYVDKGSMKFVFGVNVTASEIEKGFVKIYLSMLSNRNTMVYDDKGMLKGNILNLAKEDAPFYANFFQYYDIPEIAPMYYIKFVGDTSNYTYEIERISSEMGAENKIIDISKDIIYYKDKLKISFSKEKAYEFEHIMINGKTFENYSTIEVVEDLNIDVKSVLKTFDVSVTIDEGGTLTLNRVSSSYANAPLGVVSTSDTFYYGDYLKAEVSLEEKHRLIEFTVNGTVKPEYEQILVIEDINIVAKIEGPGPKTVWEGNVAYDFLEKNGLEEEIILDMREVLDYDITFNMHSRVRITFSELQICYADRVDTIPDGEWIVGVYRNETMLDQQNYYGTDYPEFKELFGDAYLYFERYWEQGYASEEPTRYLKFKRNYVQESDDFKYIYSRVVMTKIELIY